MFHKELACYQIYVFANLLLKEIFFYMKHNKTAYNNLNKTYQNRMNHHVHYHNFHISCFTFIFLSLQRHFYLL